MIKATSDGSALPSSPSIASVKKAMEQAAQEMIAVRNAQAKPGVKWSWSWGSRGIQYTVSVGTRRFSKPGEPKL